MAGATGVPTGLSPTPGVDYSIPLPYAVPDINTNRVGYYFAASTLGDAYRKAVAGSASDYAWIQAGATIDDTHFAAAFPPQAGLENLRSWFRAAFAALEAPGGTSAVDLLVTVTPEGAATISSKSQSSATVTAPAPSEQIAKDVAAAVVTGQVVGPTGLPTTAPTTGAGMPKWLLYGGLALAAILLFGFFRKRS